MTLTLHTCGAQGTFMEVDSAAASALPDGIVWLDLMQATPEEAAFVERATGLHVPTLAELREIESSSRLYTEDGALYMSTPVVYKADTDEPVSTALGFVLSKNMLITVRFEPLPVFENFKGKVAKPDNYHPSGVGVFAGLMEALVDRIADVLEHIGADLDGISHHVFRDKEKPAKNGKPDRPEADLRSTMQTIGRIGDLTSKIRESLLGLGRIAPYAVGHSHPWLPPEVRPDLETVRLDIASLNEYDVYLSSKVQFLLDATLGLINIEQNNVIKVLTVVSVVGVPPTLVASWYGMNFHTMPELDWSLGYPYVIALALFSAIGPLLWFKHRGWL